MPAGAQRSPVIRQAQDEDVDELSRLRLEALRTEPAAFSSDFDVASRYTREEWLSWFHQRSDGSNRVIYVADTGDRLAGMAGIARGDSPKTRHGAFLWGVYLRPGYRGQKLGRRLTEACLRWAREQGVETVRLDVNSANIAAIRLYASSGFQEVGLMPKAVRVDGVDYDELMMVLELGNRWDDSPDA